MTHNVYLYIAVMVGVTFLIRVLPMTVLRKPIRNRYFRAFLRYVPYVTLAVMTFPAIMETTSSPWMGLLALAVGGVMAWFGLGLFPVAAACSGLVLLCELGVTYLPGLFG